MRRAMMEGLEGRTMFATTTIAAAQLPKTIPAAVPVSIGNRTILPNQVFSGMLKSPEEDIPFTIVFASTDGVTSTATLTITNRKLQGTAAISAAQPTDVFIKKRKLTNNLSVTSETNGQIHVLFGNYLHPRDASTGKFEAIIKVSGTLDGTLNAAGNEYSGKFELTLDGNRTHARKGNFTAKLG